MVSRSSGRWVVLTAGDPYLVAEGDSVVVTWRGGMVSVAVPWCEGMVSIAVLWCGGMASVVVSWPGRMASVAVLWRGGMASSFTVACRTYLVLVGL